MMYALGSRLHYLRTLLMESGPSCRHPIPWIIALSILSAIAFGLAPIFLAQWVNQLTSDQTSSAWRTDFIFYLAAYGLAFGTRDLQWMLFSRVHCEVCTAITRRFTAEAARTYADANGVGLLSQTLQGTQSMLFCSFFILMPAFFETLSMLIAMIGMVQLWMAVPLLIHTIGFLWLIDYGTRRVADRQAVLSPLAARVLDLVGALLRERPLLQRFARLQLTERVLITPVAQRETARYRLGWTRTWTMTLLNLWTIVGLAGNLALALWLHTKGLMTVGQVVAVESVFFLILRRLEMWNRGYRESGQAIEMFRPGITLLEKAAPEPPPIAYDDGFTNGSWNILSGHTGVGKTTWLHTHWRHGGYQAGFHPQQAEILPGTIRFNLTLGHDMTDDALFVMLRSFDLISVIERLPARLETALAPGNSTPLSGGELQRLCLARTLLHWSSDELLLDEPTSAQSPAEGMRMIDTLRSLTHEKTVWIVSHRPEAIQWAKRHWECVGWDQIKETTS